MTRIKRTAKGTFAKGVSGNPGGRPTQDTNLRDLARTYTGEAIATLVEIMQNRKAAPSARIHACEAILDRGYGRPGRYMEIEPVSLPASDNIDPLVAARQIAFLFHRGKQALNRRERANGDDGAD